MAAHKQTKLNFYDFEQKLVYKALANKSLVIEVSAAYTSQRCPRCGRIHKENRNHNRHLYVCDCCGHQMNDDAEDASKAREMADDILYDERGRLDGYSHDMDGYEYVTTNSLTGISIQDDFTDVP